MSNRIREIGAVMYKECIDVIYNKSLILINIIFPVLGYIFSNILKDEFDFIEMSTMLMLFHTTFSPMLTIANIVADDKEKCTLKYLILLGVKPSSYLFGIGIVSFILSFVSSFGFVIINDWNNRQLINFICCNVLEIVASLVIGAVIALLVKNHVAVGIITGPTAMIISMITVLAPINDKIASCARNIYSFEIFHKYNNLAECIHFTDLKVYFINVVCFFIIFLVLYKKRGLSNE